MGGKVTKVYDQIAKGRLNFKDKLKECIDDAFGDKNAIQLCNVEAKTTFEENGGSVSDFERTRDKAKEVLVKDNLKDC